MGFVAFRPLPLDEECKPPTVSDALGCSCWRCAGLVGAISSAAGVRRVLGWAPLAARTDAGRLEVASAADGLRRQRPRIEAREHLCPPV
eukprot:8326202-Lingulodinium_polyedra.AAC.1